MNARSASSTASGSSAIIAWPASGNVTVRADGSAACNGAAWRGGAITSRAPRMNSTGQRTDAAEDDVLEQGPGRREHLEAEAPRHPAELAEPGQPTGVHRDCAGRPQLGAEAGQQLLDGEEPSVEEGVRLAALGHPASRARIAGQHVALQHGDRASAPRGGGCGERAGQARADDHHPLGVASPTREAGHGSGPVSRRRAT